MATSVIPKPPFPIGRKKVYLPNFTVTLIRSPRLPPTYARFIVPLRMNKLDLRDYLYHAYGVTVYSIRSFVQQQKVRHDKPDKDRPKTRRWFRPQAIKRMTVQMEKPFVWPEEPEDFEEWDKTRMDAAVEYSKKQQDRKRPESKMEPTTERDSMAEQAKTILQRIKKSQSDSKEV